MSLRHFHIVFITAAVILCLGTGIGLLMSEKSDMLSTFFAICSFIIAAGLVAYEFYFIHKTRNLRDN